MSENTHSHNNPLDLLVSTPLPKEGEIVSIWFKDNSEGEGDLSYMFAYMKKGVWHSYDFNKPLLEYEGDAVLEWWPMVHGGKNRLAY